MATECPYLDKPCPKLEELDEKVDRLDTLMNSVQRTLWVIAGILMCECGLMVIRWHVCSVFKTISKPMR